MPSATRLSPVLPQSPRKETVELLRRWQYSRMRLRKMSEEGVRVKSILMLLRQLILKSSMNMGSVLFSCVPKMEAAALLCFIFTTISSISTSYSMLMISPCAINASKSDRTSSTSSSRSVNSKQVGRISPTNWNMTAFRSACHFSFTKFRSLAILKRFTVCLAIISPILAIYWAPHPSLAMRMVPGQGCLKLRFVLIMLSVMKEKRATSMGVLKFTWLYSSSNSSIVIISLT